MARGGRAGREPAAAGGPAPPEPPKPRTLFEDLSRDLGHIATMLAHLAGEDAERRARRAARAGPTAPQLEAVIAARRARNPAFGLDLANPGWTLCLLLYHARLAGTPLRTGQLPVAARVSPNTAAR
jgi:hypothetical protein